MPSHIPLINLDYKYRYLESTLFGNARTDTVLVPILTFSDIEGEDNFYLIEIKEGTSKKTDEDSLLVYSIYFDDEEFDGEQLRKEETRGILNIFKKKDTMFSNLITLNKEAYDYSRDLRRARFNFSFSPYTPLGYFSENSIGRLRLESISRASVVIEDKEE